MFISPFSFDGRVRRLEYGLSYLIYIFLYAATAFIWQEFPETSPLFYLFYTVLIWLILAQGAKRCHDLNHSGFYQFIPFYVLWMIFQEGDKEDNKYGNNPKEIVQHSSKQTIEAYQHSPNYLEVITELSCYILLNTLVAAIILEYATVSDIWSFLYVMVSIIPCYGLMLFLNNKGKQNSRLHIEQRALYSCLFYVTIRLYTIYFRNAEIQIQTIYFELLLVGIILAITYLPFLFYMTFVKKKIVNDEE